MLDILRNFYDVVNMRKKSHNINLKDRAIQYINENYTDVNLGILNIAEQFDKIPSIYPGFLKNKPVGVCWTIYIRSVWTKQNKLLKDKNHNIGDIAVEVGYFNNNTFTRSFKKFEGITPKMYRDINSKS